MTKGLSIFASRHQSGPQGDHDIVVLTPPSEIVNVQESQFHLVMTTRLLASNAMTQVNGVPASVHMDATHKCVHNGFPLFVVGVVDCQQRLRPVAYCISSHEDTDAFVLCLRRVVEYLRTEINFVWAPRFTMNDNCDALFNAFQHVFPGSFPGSCYFHFQKKARDHRHIMTE